MIARRSALAGLRPRKRGEVSALERVKKGGLNRRFSRFCSE